VVTEPLSHRVTESPHIVLPGPAGIAPASRRRPPAHSGRLRALGVVRQRRALCYAAELRYPVARGLAHARHEEVGIACPLLRLFLVPGCIARHLIGAAESAICVIDDTASPKAHVGCPPPHLRREVSAAPRARRRTNQLTNSPTHQLTNSPTHQVTNSPRLSVAGATKQRVLFLSSGSRVDPLPIAPCRAGRRRSTMLHRVAVLLFFPDHRLSNSASIRVDAPALSSSCCCIAFRW
jgi:hypothetical protein